VAAFERCHVLACCRKRGLPDLLRSSMCLAPWKLNRTLSDVLLLEVISGAEWAMTLVACFSLTTR